MKAILAAAGAAMLVTSVTADAAPRRDPEAQLAKMLEGRTAGQPQDCIPLYNARSSRIIDRTAIVFETGSTLWVNRPERGAEDLDRSDTLVIKASTSRLCDVDVVRTIDATSRFPTGVVFLGSFVPYRKAR